LTGLSVRSLLDLYLSSKSYPQGSEVIIVPPINIEGMIDVMHYHGIKIVPVDIESYENDDSDKNRSTTRKSHPSIRIDMDKVKRRISSKTVAVLIVHPFGIISATDDELQELRSILNQCTKKQNVKNNVNMRDKSIEIWEDCAECFTGDYGYRGSPYVDVQYFSFGTIKTSTALGGGICTLNKNVHRCASSTAEKMKRLERMLYEEQTKGEYMKKIIMALILQLLAKNYVVLGIIQLFLNSFGLRWDDFITSILKGFPTSAINIGKYPTRDQVHKLKKVRAENLINRLRKQPNPALLSLLHRRLQRMQTTSRTVKQRILRCEKMRALIEKHVPSIKMPRGASSSHHLYWLFPIITPHPDDISKKMNNLGYDIPRGTSQLRCVTSFLDDDEKDECPNTTKMMRDVLYVPIASLGMRNAEMEQLVSTLATVSNMTFNFDISNKRKRSKPRLPYNIISVLMLALVVDSCALQILPTSVVLRQVLPGMLCFLLALLLALHILRVTIGKYYLKCSKSFARLCTIMKGASSADKIDEYVPPALINSGAELIDGFGNHMQEYELCKHDVLRLPAVGDFGVRKRQVLLAGSTGFIGSLLLRELLMNRSKLGIEGGVVVICRSKRNQNATERVKALLARSLFAFMSDEEKETLVTVVEGDVSCPRLGMLKEDFQRLVADMDISHVINSAACVNFTEPLENAAESNITSALQLQSLTKKLKDKDAKYVYLSTAFVHGNKKGSKENPLPETLFDFKQYDPLELYKSMMESQSYASSAMQDLGFPNTYTFTKSICEHLLMKDKEVETTIIRPSIVGPAVETPFEGWAGEKPSTLVAGACLYLKSPCNIWAFGKERAAVIPVDVVCRFVISKTFETSKESENYLIPGKDGHSTPCDSDQFSQESYRSSEESYIFPSENRNDLHTEKEKVPRIVQKFCCQSIHNAVWNSSSPPSTGFLWYDYACAIVQLASARGHVDKVLAYMVLLFSFKFFLAMDLSLKTFRKVHRIVVHGPILLVTAFCQFLGLRPKFLSRLDRLSPFLDLPVLFFPFTMATYHFDSSLHAPLQFNAERYMFSTILAAESFVNRMNERLSKINERRNSWENIKTEDADSCNSTVVAGKNYNMKTSDLWWSLTQPNGNYAIRVIGWIVIKILRSISTEVTIDVESFSQVAKAKEAMENKRVGEDEERKELFVVLAPTHRSLLDFIILSFIAFSNPELGLDIPNIAAADDFSRIPILGFFAKLAGAFFLARGKKGIDPSLQKKVQSLKKSHGTSYPTCFEVFLEGKRSRDRRFVKPKTGFLRCLMNTGGNHLIVPITVNYEAIPEQSDLTTEANGRSRSKLALPPLFSWLRNVRSGKINIGKIHVSASIPISLRSSDKIDINSVAKTVQQLQIRNVVVSHFHIKAGASILEVDSEIVEDSLRLLGSKLWSSIRNDNDKRRIGPLLPTSLSERWVIFLHYGHLYAQFLVNSHPPWAAWLNDCGFKKNEPSLALNANISLIVNLLKCQFDKADSTVKDTLSWLKQKGFSSPTQSHIMQYIREEECEVPALLLHQAISTCLALNSLSDTNDSEIAIQPLFQKSKHSESTPISFGGLTLPEESFGAWGYKDSRFVVNIDDDGSKIVTMKGDRYTISGRPMPKLISFLEDESELHVDPLKISLSSTPSVTIPDSDLTIHGLNVLLSILDNDRSRVSTGAIERTRHGTGHSQDDMYMIRNDSLSQLRLPDVVVYPQQESEVEELVSLAAKESWCIIPFGGGTNVCHATWCPPKTQDPRLMVSLDTRLMNKILAINVEDLTLHVQAGITGGDLVQEMQSRGFTIGHEPDSIEFSTLGGWIATKASGMKQNKYGNIEQIVKEVRVVSSAGKLWQHNQGNGASFERVSTGTDLCSLMVGSEGSLGIITSALIRIWPIPQIKEYDSVVFHTFDDGLRFVKDVSKLGALKPASVRLLDNTQFRLGQALKSKDTFVGSVKRKCMKTVVNLFAEKFDPNIMVCTTITFEGFDVEVKSQMSQIKALAAKHGGLCTGSEIGKAGYDMTYAIAYIRDFAMTYGYLAESFETFVPWSKVRIMIIETKKRLRKEHQDRALPGNPIITCRVTQLYDGGVCVYFYFCMNFENVQNPSHVFAEIEVAAREEILSQGGSLSHHHGIGKHRAHMMDRVNSENLKTVFMRLKDSMDPQNIFGARNGSYA